MCLILQTIVLGSTKTGHTIPIDEALKLSSYAAGVCYMKDDIESILNEDIEKTQRRIDLTLNSGHHSVYQHVHYTLVFRDIPKIVAMLINNEKPYTTSEKSARYTKMKKIPEGERTLYEKWCSIFEELIKKEYPLLKDNHIKKLAMENARYVISVFTPTTMVYTTNLCQINYLIEMLVKFIRENQEQYPDHPFFTKLNKQIVKFFETLKPFEVEGMNRKNKNVKLSLFNLRKAPENPTDYFDDVYSTYYWASFAQLAQSQRHRTLHYMAFMDNLDAKNNTTRLYVPNLIKNTSYQDEWLEDLISLPEDSYPQATEVLVNERGLYEHFILKCYERLCCQAQNEIMQQTKETFIKYKRSLELSNPEHKIHQDFPKIDLDNLSKVQLKTMWCAGSCNNFGRRYALNRKA